MVKSACGGDRRITAAYWPSTYCRFFERLCQENKVKIAVRVVHTGATQRNLVVKH